MAETVATIGSTTDGAERREAEMLTLLHQALQSTSIVAGFYAAWLWLQASQVDVASALGPEYELDRDIPPARVAALLRASRKVAEMNQGAAVVMAIGAAAQGALALLARLDL